MTDFGEKFFHDGFTGTFDTDVKEPVQVVDTGGDDFEIAGLPAEHFSDDTERTVNLMAETESTDVGVIFEISAEERHRVGEVEEPCFGAETFHVGKDLLEHDDVSGGVNDTAGCAVFAFDLIAAELFGDEEVMIPVVIAVGFAGGDDIVSIGESVSVFFKALNVDVVWFFSKFCGDCFIS